MADRLDGTTLGRDGKRYPTGSVPASASEDASLVKVYGTPGPGKSIVWDGANSRLVWASAIDLVEQATPPAAAANTGRVFSQDNGSGKTQMLVRFGSGAAQVVATEP